MLKMTRKQYQDKFVNADYNSPPGYCCECDMEVYEDVEPDAEEQECPECGTDSLMGHETALAIGHIDITDLDPEDEDDDNPSFDELDLDDLDFPDDDESDDD